MRAILPDIFTWSWLSEPHGYDFNGYLVVHAEGLLNEEWQNPSLAMCRTNEPVRVRVPARSSRPVSLRVHPCRATIDHLQVQWRRDETKS